jgi:membrane protein
VDALLLKLEKLLWNPRLTEQSAAAQTFIRFIQFAYALLRDVFTSTLTLRAMGLVYITILSLVPMLALVFAALKVFGIHQSMLKPLLLNVFQPLGANGVEVTNRLIGFVENVEGGFLAGLGLLLLIYTTVSMIHKIESSLNFIWRVRNDRSLLERFGRYLSIVLIGPLLMVTAIGLIATIGSNALVERILENSVLGPSTVMAGKLMPYVLVSMAFAYLFWFIPNTRVRFSAALVGGITGGVLWAFSGVAFASFVVHSTHNITIYASFAIVIIALTWLYISWVILLIGAQTAFYFQNPDYLQLGYRQLDISNRMREQLALSMMLLVADSFRNGGQTYTSNMIGLKLGLPGLLLSPVKRRLVNAGLLEVGSRDQLLPASDPGSISVGAVFEAIRSDHDTDIFHGGRWPAKVENIFAELRTLTQEPLNSITLYQLLDQQPVGPGDMHSTARV